MLDIRNITVFQNMQLNLFVSLLCWKYFYDSRGKILDAIFVWKCVYRYVRRLQHSGSRLMKKGNKSCGNLKCYHWWLHAHLVNTTTGHFNSTLLKLVLLINRREKKESPIFIDKFLIFHPRSFLKRKVSQFGKFIVWKENKKLK